MKKYLLTFFALLISNVLNAQFSKNRVDFLVDTISMNSNNKFISIDYYSPFEPCYTFYCYCIPSLNYFTKFSYFKSKQKPSAPSVNEKPNYDFLKWKELHVLLQ